MATPDSSSHGLRVLHVHTRYRQRGGEDTVVEAERQLLADAGYELQSLDFANPTTSADSTLALARAPGNRAATELAVEQARSHRADVVHIHNMWFALSPAVVTGLRRAGFPVVVTFHNYRPVCINAMLFRDGRPCELCVGRSTFPGVRHRCYRDSLGASAMASITIQLHRRRSTWANDLSVAIVLTEFAKDRLLQGGLPAERTVIKPNFVADPGPRTNPPSDSGDVLFVGRLSPEKGIDRLLEAWDTAQPEGLRLNVIGSSATSWLSETQVPNVRMLGRLEPGQVRARMLASRALVVPSIWYEGQPMVILEALAAGLPVLHTDIGALGETVGGGGLSIGLGGVKGMTAELDALTDGFLMDRTGGAGRDEFESRFSEGVGLRALGAIYEAALDRMG